MGISMSNATVDTSKRDDMFNSKYDYNTLGKGTQFNQTEVVDNEGGWFGWGRETHNEDTGMDVAGITGDFVTNFNGAINSYAKNVEEALKQLDGVTESQLDEAIKGTEIRKAVVEFVQQVRATAKAYLDSLYAAEKQIISSVEAAYAQQDVDLAANLRNDADDIKAAGPTVADGDAYVSGAAEMSNAGTAGVASAISASTSN